VSVNTHINQLVILVFVRENRSQIAKCEVKAVAADAKYFFVFVHISV